MRVIDRTAGGGVPLEFKDDGSTPGLQEVKKLLLLQGEAFDAFKKTHADEIAEIKKRGGADAVTTEKLAKIEASLDAYAEQKAAVDARFAAEKKEREDLEARLNRANLGKGEDGERQVKLQLFNRQLKAAAAERKKDFAGLDQAGYDAYAKAQERFLREGKDGLSPEEVKVMAVGDDPNGGYLVTPDMSGRIVKRVYETSPIRQIASAQTISSDALEGKEDLDEAGAGYGGERRVSGNTKTPTLGQWKIPVFVIDTEPKATQQMLDDPAVDIEAWLADKVADKFGRFENAEFVGGATNRIQGFTATPTAADDGSGVAWGSLGFVKTGANGAFAASNPGDKIYDLIGLLKDAYLNNARFVTRRAVVTLIRKFKDTTGQYLWQPSFTQGQPEQIAGYPLTRAEDMPALATNGFSLAFGDFRQGYQIVDRQGVRVLRDPFTEKPYVKFYNTKRTGGGVVNYEAIKLLQFAA